MNNVTANEDSPVQVIVADGIASIALNRPAQLNAINKAMRLMLRAALERAADDDTVKVAVITGAGGRAFSSGADLKEVGSRTAMQRRGMYDHEPSTVIRRFPKPIIAAIRGYAVGGGLELASACDIRIAADDAQFGYPEIRYGWLPAGGGTQSLPRLIGMGRAMELVLTGRFIGAEEALAIRLVDAVHPVERFSAAVNELASSIAQHRLGALLLAKSALRMSENTGSDVGHSYERELGALAYTLEGREEALTAFAERSDRAGDMGVDS